MAFKNDGVQVQEYLYDVDGGDSGAVGTVELSAKSDADPLPSGAIVEEVVAYVQGAFAGGSLEWGDGVDPDGYSGTAVAAGTLVADYYQHGSRNSAALLGTSGSSVSSDNERKVEVTVSGSPMTAGKLKLLVKFYMPA